MRQHDEFLMLLCLAQLSPSLLCYVEEAEEIVDCRSVVLQDCRPVILSCLLDC